MPLCTNCMKQVQSLRTLPGKRGQKHVCKSCFYKIQLGIQSKQVTSNSPSQVTQRCVGCGSQTTNGSLCSACTMKQAWQYIGSGRYWFTPRRVSLNFGIPYGKSFSQFLDDLDEEPMPKATLSYEALTLDNEGIPLEGAYKLKLEGHSKQHIEPIVIFIKATIPSDDRSYDPTTYTWFYHEKWHTYIVQALSGSHFQVVYGVTKEDFTELKRKQAEWAKQAGQVFQTKQYPVDNDIRIFEQLLLPVPNIGKNGDFSQELKNWSREEAIAVYKKAIKFYHPDLHPERASQASELNEVWSRLKEGYYIK